MSKCNTCGAPYEVGDAVCPSCGNELPAPYEGLIAAEDDGYDTGEFPNAVRQAPAAPALDLRAMKLRPEELTILSGATVVLSDGVFEQGSVIIGRGLILEVVDYPLVDPQNGARFFDITGMWISAGFIDVHVHGMMGIDTNKASVEDFKQLSAIAAEHGVTTLTPTTFACPADHLASILRNLREANEQGLPGARLPGLHLESNFISPDFKGAQPLEQIFAPADPRAEPIKALIDEYKDLVKIVTLAPEMPGALELIGWLRERGIISSLGHSAANYEQAIAGIEAGATHATHLFNAMPPLHHRNPGLVGACLERDEVFTEVVCDGMHVHPALISSIITCKGSERFLPISDGLEAAGRESGEFYCGNQHVTIIDGIARLDNGTIAGSITIMDKIVRFLVNRVGWDAGEAMLMASATPAEALELTNTGTLAQGATADIVILDADLNVVMTIVGGEVVFRHK